MVLPKLTSPPYLMNMRSAPADSPNFAQTENHYITLPDAHMPHTPICNKMYEAGLMNPSAADRIWKTHRCNLKLAVTMFKPAELECYINSLSACRLVVPKPAPASSTAQTIWLLTQAQMDMGATTKQKGRHTFHPRPRKCIGCHCIRPRAELTRRLQHGEITGPATKCQLYVSKAPILPAQLRKIFQRSPANMESKRSSELFINRPVNHRQATPLPAPTRATPKRRPMDTVGV